MDDFPRVGFIVYRVGFSCVPGRRRLRERVTGFEGIERQLEFEIFGGDPGQAAQGQTQTHGRITRQHIQTIMHQWPATGFPARLDIGIYRLDWKNITDPGSQTLAQLPGECLTNGGMIQIGGMRVDVGGQSALLVQRQPGILEGGNEVARIESQMGRERLAKGFCCVQ